jgi:glycosyltransferase involved in cell wall biosynthesis
MGIKENERNMNLLFILDHPFYIDNMNVYSGGGLPAKTWDNYLSSFDEIKVMGRQSNKLKDKNVLSSGNNKVSFNLISDYSSKKNLVINFFKIKQKIQEQILLSDFTIIRLPSILGCIAGYIAIKNKRTFIIEQVGNAKEALTFHKSFLGKISASTFHKINKYIVKRSPYVVYVTEKKLQKDYPTRGKTESISDVILPEILSVENIENTRFYSDKIRIALIGGFDTRYKGQDILLKAISILPIHIKNNIEIYFVGNGDHDWVIEKAKRLQLVDNIKFIGAKKAGEEIFQFLQCVTLYIQPSFTEGMPRAMLEAMSMGCPVLSSSVGGMPDVVNNEYLHKAGDYKTLSKQILRFYNNRNLLKEESSENLKRVLPYLIENLKRKRSLFFHIVINNTNEK